MVRLEALLFILRRWARPTKASSPSKKKAEINTPPCTAPALTAKGMASGSSLLAAAGAHQAGGPARLPAGGAVRAPVQAHAVQRRARSCHQGCFTFSDNDSTPRPCTSLRLCPCRGHRMQSALRRACELNSRNCENKRETRSPCGGCRVRSEFKNRTEQRARSTPRWSSHTRSFLFLLRVDSTYVRVCGQSLARS